MKTAFVTFLCFLIISCSGTPKPGISPLQPEPAERPLNETEEGPSAAVTAPEVLPTEPPPPVEPLVMEINDEPQFEFAETDAAPQTPQERVEVAALPEPAAPFAEPPSVAQALPETAAPQTPLAAETPAPQTPAQAPPQPRPIPPPPALLGPAEEIIRAAAPEPDKIETKAPAVPSISETPLAGVRQDSVVYSRTVRATVGQIVEIPFRGTGWVYLGELASRRGIVYDSRRLDPEGQSFLFRTEEAGSYSLKFYKQDFIRDYILNDHVQVIVGEASVNGAGWFSPPYNRDRIVAEPRWPSTLEESAMQRGDVSGSKPPADAPAADTPSAVTRNGASPVAEGAPPVADGAPPSRETAVAQPPLPAAAPGNPPVTGGPPSGAVSETQERLPPDALLQKAREAFNQGNTQAAIALLDQYREHYPSGSDEVYWLYGQFYEANSPSRDILSALDYYRRLAREYPQSSRCNDARRRIAYLERFYINIQ